MTSTKNTTTSSTTTILLLVAVVLSSLAVISDAFLLAPMTATTTIPPQSLASRSLSSTSSGGDYDEDARRRTITVISPPGGLGEMSAIESARLGGNVRWFVVSRPSSSSSSTSASATAKARAATTTATTTVTTASVSLSSGTVEAIRKSGGSLEFAGAYADDLLGDRGGGALAALGSWCSGSSAVLCTYDDGATTTGRGAERSAAPGDASSADPHAATAVRAGIRLAAREVARGGMTTTMGGDDANDEAGAAIVAMLAAGEEREGEEDAAGVVAGGGGVLGGLGSMFAGLVAGGGKEEDGMSTTTTTAPPRTLKEAVTGGGRGGAATVIRYGELFGAPESSPESSHFVGGPRRDPVVREMYSMRSVRIDPAVVVTTSSSVGEGGVGGGGGMGYRSNRLAVAEAASRLGLGMIPAAVVAGEDGAAAPTTMEVSLSSFPGTEGPTDAEWDAEFRRVVSESSPSRSGRLSPSLFRAEFSSVPSPTRLAEWLATKWAPAVLRSYDIAGIRVGARPVYASVLARGDVDDVAVVEIVWQELVNFSPVTSGRMYVEVGRSGMTATRGPGDASAGFGVPSASSLPGEDILVRRLADASSQAVEKGLAIKAVSVPVGEEDDCPPHTDVLSTKKVEMASTRPVTTVVGTPPADDTGVPSSPESSGPRNAGARKSSERTRGSRKPASTPSSLTESGGE
ncbi:hypothetical protein ACHAW5_006683 [Stephanodiscus triporus]|uniref:Uncharacterized protein n=1 Tax=Stephanodiscus triporus TaxID=2934178 RepID=A0ABD3MIJ0_9STRA